MSSYKVRIAYVNPHDLSDMRIIGFGKAYGSDDAWDYMRCCMTAIDWSKNYTILEVKIVPDYSNRGMRELEYK